MKRTKIIAAFSAMVLSATLLAVSCNKNKIDEGAFETDEADYASEHALAEQTFDNVQDIADQGADMATGGDLGYKTAGITAGGCAVVTRSAGNIIVDFGTTNCLCRDGRYRRGKIRINYTGAYADSGSRHTITFDNYYQNDNKIEGTKTVTNMGRNSAGQPYFNIAVTGTITKAAGGVITTNWTRVRTWTTGYSTLGDRTDDVYEITGSGTLTRATGAVINISIPTTTPLVIALSCRWIQAGTVVYTLTSGATRTLNYGTTPACDNTAILTLPSGRTFTITLI